MNAPFLTPKTFLTAGNATVTAHALASGVHFTFKVKKGKDENAPHFVSVLTGQDNENSFTYLGTIHKGEHYAHGKKSPISADAPSAKAFAWLWRYVDNLPADKVELLPSCNCARCGRKLTVPTSIENALGPECAKKV